jgi:hypothetical protein
MFHHRLTRVRLLVLCLGVLVIGSGLPLRAAVPTAPANFQAVSSGLHVVLTWNASANNPAYYVLRAGYSPGQTAIEVPLSPASTTFSASAAAGTYYARIVAVNAEGESLASNEITVVLTNACSAPTPPRNLRAMVEGTDVYVFWTPPAAGVVTTYTLQAGLAPGTTLYQFPTGGTTLNANAIGTYYIRAVASNACGTSTESNELEVSLPGDTVRVADPEPGTVLGMPDVAALMARIHNENPGLINQSCPNNRKYENNPWQDRIIDRLRQFDTRFGYNGKPTKTPADNGGFPVIAAGDELTFFAGAGPAQGSHAVYAIVMLFSHCAGPTDNPPQIYWRDFTGLEDAFWTGAGRFTGDGREP